MLARHVSDLIRSVLQAVFADLVPNLQIQLVQNAPDDGPVRSVCSETHAKHMNTLWAEHRISEC